MSITEIENAITKLPAAEVDDLFSWLADYRHRRWDRQIADDVQAGRLDDIFAEVDAEIEAGLGKPL